LRRRERTWSAISPYIDRLPETRRSAAARQRQQGRGQPGARDALAMAADGRTVAVVSGGDPGVFRKWAAGGVRGDRDRRTHLARSGCLRSSPACRRLQGRQLHGSVRPLGHDFCAISLSDNLKPWDVVERRFARRRRGRLRNRALQTRASKGAARSHSPGNSDCCAGVKAGDDLQSPLRVPLGRSDEAITLTTLADGRPRPSPI